MLTNEQFYILFLLRASLGQLSDQKSYTEFPENYEGWETITKAIQRNGIFLTVYHKLPYSIQQQLEAKYHTAIRQSVRQDYEGKRVLKALSDAGFSCIALKGWELRKLYPDYALRQMTDLDILVRPYDFAKIKKVMNDLEYTGGTESSAKHDSFKLWDVKVEIHKRLTDDSDAIQTWERGLWDRAASFEGNICLMSPEDYYIFHFVHLHEDFMNGLLGLRRIADTWLLQKQAVDMEFVRDALKSFGILSFYEQMLQLSKAVMGETEITPDLEVLLKHAFTYGIYGSGRSYKAGRIAAMGRSINSGKLKSRLAAVFLPYKRMKAHFPILEKWPVLLPFCWSRRIIQFLKGNRKKYRWMLDYSDINEADYDAMKRFFEAGRV